MLIKRRMLKLPKHFAFDICVLDLFDGWLKTPILPPLNPQLPTRTFLTNIYYKERFILYARDTRYHPVLRGNCVFGSFRVKGELYIWFVQC